MAKQKSSINKEILLKTLGMSEKEFNNLEPTMAAKLLDMVSTNNTSTSSSAFIPTIYRGSGSNPVPMEGPSNKNMMDAIALQYEKMAEEDMNNKLEAEMNANLPIRAILEKRNSKAGQRAKRDNRINNILAEADAADAAMASENLALNSAFTPKVAPVASVNNFVGNNNNPRARKKAFNGSEPKIMNDTIIPNGPGEGGTANVGMLDSEFGKDYVPNTTGVQDLFKNVGTKTGTKPKAKPRSSRVVTPQAFAQAYPDVAKAQANMVTPQISNSSFNPIHGALQGLNFGDFGNEGDFMYTY